MLDLPSLSCDQFIVQIVIQDTNSTTWKTWDLGEEHVRIHVGGTDVGVPTPLSHQKIDISLWFKITSLVTSVLVAHSCYLTSGRHHRPRKESKRKNNNKKK